VLAYWFAKIKTPENRIAKVKNKNTASVFAFTKDLTFEKREGFSARGFTLMFIILLKGDFSFLV
jgi:hypothetical protein